MKVSSRGTEPLALYVREAAEALGLEVLNLHRVRGKNAWRFRLAPGASREYQRRGFSRNRDGERRRVNGVCWHGVRDFLRVVFVASPRARVETALATYDGAMQFVGTYPNTYNKMVGSQTDPVAFGDLCDCPAGR